MEKKEEEKNDNKRKHSSLPLKLLHAGWPQ